MLREPTPSDQGAGEATHEPDAHDEFAHAALCSWISTPMEAFTLALVVFTAGLVAVGWLQRATMVAQHQTLADSVALTRAFERPWVLPTGEGQLRCDPPPREGSISDPTTPNPPKLKIVLSNFGKSPGLDILNVKAGWEVLFDDDRLPDTLKYPRPEQKRGIGVLAPGAQFTWHTSFRVAGIEGSDMFKLFKSGVPGLRLYMYGEFTYRDSLNSGEPYFTEYCLYAKEPNADTFYMAASHNTAR